MRTGVAASIVTFVIASLVATPARAQHGNGQNGGAQQNLFALGRQQYDDLHYEEALQTLSAAIIRRGNTAQMEVQIYELLGLSYLALRRSDEAEGAFRLMLGRDPSHQLSGDVAPRDRDFFNGVKQRWESEGRPGVPRQDQPQQAAAAPVTIEHHSPAEQRRGYAVNLTATLNDPEHRVSRLVLAYRPGSHGLFHRVDALGTPSGAYMVQIPGDAVRPPLVEYYFEAVNPNGVPVQARGDAFAPLRVAVPASGGIPWWAFVGGGAVVLGGAAVAIYFIATSVQPANLTIQVQGH